MKLGYNTNGFASHSLDSALQIIAEIGYNSVAITLDVHHLNPFSLQLENDISRVRSLLEEYQLSCVIETGARYLLDSRHKHQPTLLSESPAGRDQRIDFYCRCIDIAAALNAPLISLWSGSASPDTPDDILLRRLETGLETVCRYAEATNTKVAFEPEPGMFIDTMTSWEKLLAQFDHPQLGLTLDIGHLHCLESQPIPEFISKWSDRILNIHIEDMKKGIHNHLPFGEGEINFKEVFQALKQINYSKPLYVELSRHSHAAPELAIQSYQFLNAQTDSA